MADNNDAPGGKTISKTVPITGMRRAMVRHMEESMKRSPQLSASVRMDAHAFVAYRDGLKQQGRKITYTEMFAKLITAAVQEVPLVNCSRVEDKIEYYSSINMGIAVANSTGMTVVPVICEAQQKSLSQISEEVRQLRQKVEDRTLKPEDMADGTITISSMGMFEVDAFTPILNIPQAALIGIGKIRPEACVDENGAVVARPMVTISITIDHAIIDGVTQAQFLTSLAEKMANPGKYLDE